MSRFFARGGSDSDETSSESSDDEVQQPLAPTKTFQKKSTLVLSDSDEEGAKRIVRRTKDKRFDELKTYIKQIKNLKKIKDMAKIHDLFLDLCICYQKSKAVIDKENDGKAPRFYIRYMAELEDFVVENWEDKEGKKAMSKANSRGLTTLRQKLRKYIKENFEGEMEFYREKPDPEGYETAEGEEEDGEDAGSESDVESSSESEAEVKPPKKEKKEKRKHRESGGSESWGSSSSESSDSDLEDLESMNKEKLREFFLKPEFQKNFMEKREKETRKDRKKKEQKEKPKQRELDLSGDEGWTPVGSVQERQLVLFEKNAEINKDTILKKLNELVASRGRKGTNPKQLVSLLTQLRVVAQNENLGPAMSIKILLSIISGMFEYQSRMYDGMNYETWQKALGSIRELLNLMKENPEVYCSVTVQEDQENLFDNTRPLTVHGSLLYALERLDGEFTKILQEADCHSTDYVDKLKGEKDICALILETKDFMEKQGYPPNEVCRIYSAEVEHLYYKYDGTKESFKTMETLCQFIYTNDDTKKLRTKAALRHIYHLALHDKWHDARDLMLMSHLQGTIDHAHPSDQILHNRAVAQLGLCAFRSGLIREAHSTLTELMNLQKTKEFLAQGMTTRGQEKTPEQEKIEKQRQIPYHMHVNLELLECVYLICAMLLEIPLMASREYEMKRRMLSRSFHYQLKQSERSSLTGPPENTREHVVAASRALLNGDWKACRDFIVNDKMNMKVWNLFHASERVKEMVVKRIQVESLRTYLLTFSTVYSTLSINTLSSMFEMEKKDVHALISKMIIQEELAATLDEPAECLVMLRQEPSKLQLLAIQLTEKLNYLAENNEQILDPRLGQQSVRPQASNWFAQRQGQGRGEYGRKPGYNRGFGDQGRRQQYRRN